MSNLCFNIEKKKKRRTENSSAEAPAETPREKQSLCEVMQWPVGEEVECIWEIREILIIRWEVNLLFYQTLWGQGV